jgi:hypothetical protein
MSNIHIPVISPETGRPRPLSIEEIDIYHENGKGYLAGKNGEYIMMSTADVRRHLLTLGFSRARRLPMSELEQAIHDIQVNKSIAYSGPLAGYSAGMRKISGKYILVTGAPTLIKADPSVDWPILRELIERLLGADNGKQLRHLYGWLKHALIALEENRITQGQVLAIAGPRGCGKSLLQQVIREVLGGREANPYPYMTGAQFNRDLFGAENLMFGDEVASCDYRNRVKIGSMMKQLTVNSTQRCHGKHREAVILAPLWRVTMSLNDEISNLQVLPPLSHDSIIDKIILLKAEKPSFLDQDDWLLRTREQNWARIQAELPGFVAFLHSFEIPRELADSRFGIKYYQNPDLLSVLKSEAPERRLLELIDSEQLYYAPERTTIIPKNGPHEHMPREAWVGTASELEARLDQTEKIKYLARKLLSYQSALGQYLSSLGRDYPKRVQLETKKDGIQRYRLLPPSSE